MPTGDWSFYGFYWEDSTAYCTWKTKELIGATEKINLEFSKENCLHPKFASQKYIDFNQKTKNPLIVIPCKKYVPSSEKITINSVQDIESKCEEDTDFRSVRVSFHEIGLSSVNSPSFNTKKTITECVDITNDDAVHRIFVPVGGSNPFFMNIIFYSDASCTTEMGKTKLRGLFNDPRKAQLITAELEDIGKTNIIALMMDHLELSAHSDDEDDEDEDEDEDEDNGSGDGEGDSSGESNSNIGETCVINSDCTSNYCAEEYDDFGQLSGKYICERVHLYNYCESNEDCISNYCEDSLSLCLAKGTGENCEHSDECYSSNCEGVVCNGESCTPGTCGQSELYQYCENDGDCQNNSCKTLEGQTTLSRDGKVIEYESHSCTKGYYQEPCNLDSECNSNVCTENKCFGKQEGENCSDDIDCISNNCDQGTCQKSDLWGGCTEDSNCNANQGWCIEGYCQLRQVFSYCLQNSECGTSNCVANICLYKTFGESCSLGNECISQTCTNNKCTAPIFPGGSCESNSDCTQAETCIGGLCQSDDITQVSLCNNNQQDGTETDVDCGGFCSYLSGDNQCSTHQSCFLDTDCQSGTCDNDSRQCIDQSITFLGNGYIFFNNTAAPAIGVRAENEPTIDDDEAAKSYSINIWFKTNVSSNQYLITQREAGQDYSLGQYMFHFTSTNTIQFIKYHWDNQWNTFKVETNVTDSATYDYADGEWHMATVSKMAPTNNETKTYLKLFIDGKLKDESDTETFQPITNLNKVYIGANVRDFNNYFTGTLDNITFWDTALSDSEVEKLYNSGSAINPLVNIPGYNKADAVTQHYNVNRDELHEGDTPTFYNEETLVDHGSGNTFHGTGEGNISYNDFGVSEKYLHINQNGMCPELMSPSEFEIDDRLDWKNLTITAQNGKISFSDKKDNAKTVLMNFNEMVEEETIIIQGKNGVDFYKEIAVVNTHYEELTHFITVNETSDGVGTKCNIRNAIQSWSSPGNSSGECTEGVSSNPNHWLTVINFAPVDNALSTHTFKNGAIEIECEENQNCTFLKIIGCGKDKTTLNGDGKDRVFVNRAHTELVHMKIINGRNDSGLGGAIHNYSSLTMDKVKITQSQANGLPGDDQNYGGGDGGGACFGGAIYNDENTELILLAGVEFIDNTCISGHGGSGGALECTNELMNQGKCP